MSLFLAILLVGGALLASGLVYAVASDRVRGWSFSWPRSKVAALILFGPASVWFLWHVAHLGQADFGDYRHLLVLGFGVIAVGSFFVVRDFLAVRGLAALVLLSARPLLDAAYMQYDVPARLVMVTSVYALLVLALWTGATPYIMRDFYEWLYFKEGRARVVGALVALWGIVVLGTLGLV